MPIVDLARRLEDAGVAALTIHCRTAQMGHSGAADWSWAARAREVVPIPVIVNGDVKSAGDAERALARDGLRRRDGRPRAIEHPWIFREARALLDRGVHLAAARPPTSASRSAASTSSPTSPRAASPTACASRAATSPATCTASAAPPRCAGSLLFCDSLEGCLAILTEAGQDLAA